MNEKVATETLEGWRVGTKQLAAAELALQSGIGRGHPQRQTGPSWRSILGRGTIRICNLGRGPGSLTRDRTADRDTPKDGVNLRRRALSADLRWCGVPAQGPGR